MAFGLAGVTMDRTVDAEIGGTEFSTGDSRISGGAVHTELTLGGSPTSGLVIGGTVLSYVMGQATIEGESGATRDLDSPLRVVALGPSIDWYPSPTGGFHFGGMVGVGAAWARLPEEDVYDGIGGGGGALGLQVGYDWWVAHEWSLGGLLRLTGVQVRGEDTEVGVTAKERSGVGALSIAFTALYH
jgi:hypothetical protein